MPGLIEVTADTVEKHGFFCKMSARKTSAWQQKKAWLETRFAEGLQLRLLGGGERGFIEYIPGKYAWRAIDGADDFVVIHCLWVVGKSKGHGFSTLLLDDAESWARKNGYRGVVALTSAHKWLMEKGVLERRGYRSIESAAPSFDLMVREFKSGKLPKLSGNWERKAKAMGKGLAVIRTAQCPYLEDATAIVRKLADKKGLAFSERVLKSAAEVRKHAPAPYGVYAVMRDGRLVASQYLLEKDLAKAVEVV